MPFLDLLLFVSFLATAAALAVGYQAIAEENKVRTLISQDTRPDFKATRPQKEQTAEYATPNGDNTNSCRASSVDTSGNG